MNSLDMDVALRTLDDSAAAEYQTDYLSAIDTVR